MSISKKISPRNIGGIIAGSLNSKFYQSLDAGKYGEEGRLFYKAMNKFVNDPKRKCSRMFYKLLVTCNLENNYNASFAYYLKSKYAEYRGKKVENVTNEEFFVNEP